MLTESKMISEKNIWIEPKFLKTYEGIIKLNLIFVIFISEISLFSRHLMMNSFVNIRVWRSSTFYGFYFFVIRPQKRLMRIRQGVKNSPLGVKFSYGVKNRKNYGLYPRELIIRFLKVNPKSQIVFSLIWIIVFKKFYDSSNFGTKIFDENLKDQFSRDITKVRKIKDDLVN